MSAAALSRLIQVDLREVWKHEAGDFTPWLASQENLALLGDALGIDLELEAQEKDVGPFRADILCKDTATGQWVLIENQLERTDHSHLGQLITYAAGLRAVTVVWISSRFTDEHRAALDWLNEATSESFNFFGLEVELWRIDNSPAAPKFNLVSKPNDWTKAVAESKQRIENGDLTAIQATQLAYWTALREELLARGKNIRPTKPQAQNWIDFALGRSDINLAAVTSGADEEGEIRAELLIKLQPTMAVFAQFEQEKQTIEAEFGEPLTWDAMPNRRSCKIFARRPANIQNRSDWPNQHAWLREKLEALHRVFSRRAKALNPSELESFVEKMERGHH